MSAIYRAFSAWVLTDFQAIAWLRVTNSAHQERYPRSLPGKARQQVMIEKSQ